jgi:hypothetical protein
VTEQDEPHRPGDYVTARDLARLLRVPLGTIYRWASEDGWRRTRYRPIRYHMDDAVNSKRARELTTA